MTKSYEMNTIFETAINRQIEVQTAAYSFGEEAVSKCEVSFGPGPSRLDHSADQFRSMDPYLDYPFI